MENVRFFLSENFQFLVVKISIYLNRRVFVMPYPRRLRRSCATNEDSDYPVHQCNLHCPLIEESWLSTERAAETYLRSVTRKPIHRECSENLSTEHIAKTYPQSVQRKPIHRACSENLSTERAVKISPQSAQRKPIHRVCIENLYTERAAKHGFSLLPM